LAQADTSLASAALCRQVAQAADARDGANKVDNGDKSNGGESSSRRCVESSALDAVVNVAATTRHDKARRRHDAGDN